MTKPERRQVVLVVDDDDDARSLLCLALAAAGYATEAAADGSQALERIQALKPDLVLLDVMMPGDGRPDGARAPAPE